MMRRALQSSLLLLLAGCGFMEPDFGQVTVAGHVFVDGAPQPYVLVYLTGPPSSAYAGQTFYDVTYTDAEGRYEVSGIVRSCDEHLGVRAVVPVFNGVPFFDAAPSFPASGEYDLPRAATCSLHRFYDFQFTATADSPSLGLEH